MRRRDLHTDCTEVLPCSGSRVDVLFVARVKEVSPSISCFFQGPQHFNLPVFSRCLPFHCLVQGPRKDKTWLPTLVLRLHENVAWQMASKSSSTSDGPHHLFPAFVVSMKEQTTPSSCARKRDLVRSFLHDSSQEVCCTFLASPLSWTSILSPVPIFTTALLSTALDFLSPSMILRRLFSSKLGPTIMTGLSPRA